MIGCDWADAQRLIEERPLAWVSAPLHGEGSLLPLVARYDAIGRPAELIGHFARRNPLAAIVEEDPRVEILFKGPDAYVSPRHVGRRDWGPTWNYAQLHIIGDLFIEEALTEEALRLLIEKVEAGAEAAWSAEELGARYETLLAHIVGFRIQVGSVSGRFKLGQDEAAEDLSRIIANSPDRELAHWMRTANRGRLGELDDMGD
nr:FMN-binding negative transcriptional regulator [Pacificimonas flava]